MSDPFISQITGFGLNFVVRGWAYCNGAILQIASDEALFSLIGCTYGGDCRTTMALPDLRGRISFQHGTGPGLPTYTIGQRGGNESTTATISTLASHNHNDVQIGAAALPATQGVPSSATMLAIPLSAGVPVTAYVEEASQNATLSGAGSRTGFTGSSQRHSIQNPYVTISYEIALIGVFPSRN